MSFIPDLLLHFLSVRLKVQPLLTYIYDSEKKKSIFL